MPFRGGVEVIAEGEVHQNSHARDNQAAGETWITVVTEEVALDTGTYEVLLWARMKNTTLGRINYARVTVGGTQRAFVSRNSTTFGVEFDKGASFSIGSGTHTINLDFRNLVGTGAGHWWTDANYALIKLK